MRFRRNNYPYFSSLFLGLPLVLITLLIFISPVVFVGSLASAWYWTKKEPNEGWRRLSIIIAVISFFGTLFFIYSVA